MDRAERGRALLTHLARHHGGLLLALQRRHDQVGHAAPCHDALLRVLHARPFPPGFQLGELLLITLIFLKRGDFNFEVRGLGVQVFVRPGVARQLFTSHSPGSYIDTALGVLLHILWLLQDQLAPLIKFLNRHSCVGCHPVVPFLGDVRDPPLEAFYEFLTEPLLGRGLGRLGNYLKPGRPPGEVSTLFETGHLRAPVKVDAGVRASAATRHLVGLASGGILADLVRVVAAF